MSLNKELVELAKVHVGKELADPYYIFSNEDGTVIFAVIQDACFMGNNRRARLFAASMSLELLQTVCLEHTEEGWVDNYSMGIVTDPTVQANDQVPDSQK